jgi:hypothetical protein
MSSPVKRHQTRYRSRRALARWTRRLWPLIGGVALQAAPAGCDQQLTTLLNTFSQDIVNGIGTGISNLLQALTLTLFV